MHRLNQIKSTINVHMVYHMDFIIKIWIGAKSILISWLQALSKSKLLEGAQIISLDQHYFEF